MPPTFDVESKEKLVLTDPTARALYDRIATIQAPEPFTLKGTADATLTTGAEKIVRDLLTAASEAGASDIHLESEDGRMVVRFRIDGILQSPDNWMIESADSVSTRSTSAWATRSRATSARSFGMTRKSS